MGLAATTFANARTIETFKAWYAEEPAAATEYLKAVATKAGNVAALNQLDQFTAAPPADAPTVAATFYTAVDTAPLGPTQAARSATLGWEVSGIPREPPALTGKITLEGPVPMLMTPVGKFRVSSVNPVGTNDIVAFTERVVTVKGWPAPGWQPSPAGKGTTRGLLIVEEFAPGASGDFVTGRVQVSGSDVTINVRPDKQVKVTNPELKAALAPYDRLGIVLPGAPERQGTEWLYSNAPEAYYILAGFLLAGGVAPQTDPVQFSLQLAHGKSLPCVLPRAAWDATSRGQRHYFYGRIEGGSFKAQGVTPSAGSWEGEPTFTRGAESILFIKQTEPVGTATYAPEEVKFGL